MSKIFVHPVTGGELYQAGAHEIPHILRNKDIDLLILAAEKYQPRHIPNTGGGFETAEVWYVPMKDTVLFTPKKYKDTVKRAKIAAKRVIEHLEQGNNVLSTCWAGWNRSGLISGLALTGMTLLGGNQVVNLIRKRRSKNALSNPLFAYTVSKS